MVSRRKLRTVVLVALAALTVPILAPSNYLDELRSISETDSGTARGRRFLWTSAFNMWRDNPILGVGARNSTFLLGRYQPNNPDRFSEREYNERDWSGSAIHSFYFELLADQGTVGMAMVGFLVWQLFSLNRRTIRAAGRSSRAPPGVRRDGNLYAHALNGAMIALLTAGAFLSVGYYPYLFFFTALAAALNVAVRAELARDPVTLPAPAPAG
jgi:O-antigen ligase